jgi:hypothetical protein
MTVLQLAVAGRTDSSFWLQLRADHLTNRAAPESLILRLHSATDTKPHVLRHITKEGNLCSAAAQAALKPTTTFQPVGLSQ